MTALIGGLTHRNRSTAPAVAAIQTATTHNTMRAIRPAHERVRAT
jgi:hypothetical protein